MAAFPTDVLIVEDDPIIALDFADTIIGFGGEDRARRRERGAGAARIVRHGKVAER
ncbi:MAG TPA: hypothetical protein VGM09_15900 [Bradyrhizobium sp.]